MASPNSTFTELVSTTFRNHKKEFADNVSNRNVLLARMMERGKKRVLDGGLSIVCELDYAENGTYQRYSGYDTLNVQASDVLSAAEYSWKQAAVHVTASGRELRINSSANQIIQLAKSRLTNAMRTFKNQFSSDLYSDGTAANQITGLQAIIADAGTGTVGGIDSSTFTFWQNGVQSAASPIQGGGAITPSATTIESLMLPLYLQLSRGNDEPDLIVADNNYYTFFNNSQTSLKRYATDEAKTVTAGFNALRYRNADVVFDGGSGIPADRMYFINTDYLELCCHRDADMTQMEDKSAINQDAVVMPILFMGNLTCSNRELQGIVKA
jgi:hypothetical protein